MSDTEPFPPLDPGFAQTGQNIPEIRVEEFVEIAESNHQAPLDGSSAGGPVTKNEEGSSEIQADKLDDTADGSRQPRVDLCAIQARQDEREAFIERLIKIAETLLWYCLHLSSCNITSIAFDPRSQSTPNNYFFHIELKEPLRDDYIPRPLTESLPGVYPIPTGTQRLILRFPNPEVKIVGVNEDNRVENETIAMNLFRLAVSPSYTSVVPRVYGYGSATDGGIGWIAEEYMPGDDLDKSWKSMTLLNKRIVLQQLAEIYTSVQKFELPSTMMAYGALTFDKEGMAVSKTLLDMRGSESDDPWMLYRSKLEQKWAQAAESEPIRMAGWMLRENGMEGRLKSFMEEVDGFRTLVSGIDETDKCLIHGNLTTRNILIIPTTMTITAVLGFEFAHIGHPSDEYIQSFHDIGGRLPPKASENLQDIALRHAMLAASFAPGFDHPALPTAENDALLEVGKIWANELRVAGALQPKDLFGLQHLSDLAWFTDNLCPYNLSQKELYENEDEEKVYDQLEKQIKDMDWYLKSHGY